MSFIQPSPNVEDCIACFEKLMKALSENQRTGIDTFCITKFRKEIRLDSCPDARNILKRLVEKCKIKGQRKNWKVQETDYLLFVMDKYCLLRGINHEQLDLFDWNEISTCVPHRTGPACQFRYLSQIPSSISQLPWTCYEGELLLRVIQNEKSSQINWKTVSQKFYQANKTKTYRTGKQCREHYACFLKPNLKKGSWTDQQDYQLVCLFLKFGKKWSKMTSLIEGRNQNSIKNRFFLIFENKKDLKVSNSDLVKLAKRRKEKLEKKINFMSFEKENSTENQNSITNNIEEQLHQNEIVQNANMLSSRSQIFLNEAEEQYDIAVKIEEPLSLDLINSSEEYEKYIDL